MGRVAEKPVDDDMVSCLMADLEGFSGEDSEQEDDITLVVVTRLASAQHSAQAFEGAERVLARFAVASEEGNERVAIEKVQAVVGNLGLEIGKLEGLKTAVGESVMNAIEHGNDNRAELDVEVEVRASDKAVIVLVTDQGGDRVIPEAELPDIEAKLAGEQTPRGWGLFLIEQMVDEVRSTSDGESHTVELVVNRKGDS
jgi:anti-sigma regulatory factor (Ser/Thr protein kinase)